MKLIKPELKPHFSLIKEYSFEMVVFLKSSILMIIVPDLIPVTKTCPQLIPGEYECLLECDGMGLELEDSSHNGCSSASSLDSSSSVSNKGFDNLAHGSKWDKCTPIPSNVWVQKCLVDMFSQSKGCIYT